MKKITGFTAIAALTISMMFGVSMAQQRDTRTPQEKAFEFRDGLMHTIEWKFGKLIEAKFKGDKAGFHKQAADLAYLSTMITEGFELKNSIVDKSRAKPEIWSDWDTFLKKAKNMQEATQNLTADDYDLSAFDPKKFGGQNCGGCHRDFKKRNDK